MSNTLMNPANDIDQRLTELEIKLGFSEDLVETLNQIVIRQQQQIDVLARELSRLQSQVEQGSGGGDGFRSLRDELPPHY